MVCGLKRNNLSGRKAKAEAQIDSTNFQEYDLVLDIVGLMSNRFSIFRCQQTIPALDAKYVKHPLVCLSS